MQKKLKTKKNLQGRHRENGDYLLTGKLFCGHCGGFMVGMSGTSKVSAKHQLIVDADAAEIVKRVYSMLLQGSSKRAIALYLNEHGIPSPTAYRRKKGLPVSSAVADDPMWGARMIHEILTNPIYNGGYQKMSKIAYVRVSTQEQNEARQREALAARGIDKWFIEKTSAKNTDRPEFQRMMDWIREGDTIYIHDLSRIARSTLDLLHLLNVLADKGVALVSDKENIDTGTATGKLIITVIAAINEFERANLLDRQREGIAIAKWEGRYKGRTPVTVPDLPRHYDRYQRREISKAALARELGISRPTLDRLFDGYERKKEAQD